MMDDRELALIAAFRLHEVASRLSVLSRVARSPQLRDALLLLSTQLSEREREIAGFGDLLGTEIDTDSSGRRHVS
jgi:hypothetical protein